MGFPQIAQEQAEKAVASVGNFEGSLSTAASPVPVVVTSSQSKAYPNLYSPSIYVDAIVLASIGTPTVATPVMPLLPTNPVSVMASLTPTISTSVGDNCNTLQSELFFL